MFISLATGLSWFRVKSERGFKLYLRPFCFSPWLVLRWGDWAQEVVLVVSALQSDSLVHPRSLVPLLKYFWHFDIFVILTFLAFWHFLSFWQFLSFWHFYHFDILVFFVILTFFDFFVILAFFIILTFLSITHFLLFWHFWHFGISCHSVRF